MGLAVVGDTRLAGAAAAGFVELAERWRQQAEIVEPKSHSSSNLAGRSANS